MCIFCQNVYFTLPNQTKPNYSGVIKFIGNDKETQYIEQFKDLAYDLKVDASNCSILPGLVDSHTHPVWSGDRIDEFKMKVNIN
jgi:imidazolonepropionase